MITVIILMSASMVHAQKCAGGFEHSESFGYSNLECSTVTTQVYAGAEESGTEFVTINGKMYTQCTMRHVKIQEDGDTVILYQCPDQKPKSA